MEALDIVKVAKVIGQLTPVIKANHLLRAQTGAAT